MADINRLSLEVATGVRRLTPEELREVVRHVAQTGFDPILNRATGLAGLEWAGRVLRGSDRITAAE